MRFGRYELTLPVHGYFRLDGGSMFGSVPKNLWEKLMPVDEDNCIRLAMRSLLLQNENSKILVDVGIGEKWNDKLRKIFGIKNNSKESLGVNREEITDLILTHLHFDHAGGISEYDSDSKELKLCYPNAKIFLQKENLENAKNPTPKEKASYLKENYEPLEQTEVKFTTGSEEVLPDIWVHQVDGHTLGQQWIEVRGAEQPLFFPTDLIPTSHHIQVPYHMGYDTCATTIMQEKQAFLERAIAENAIVVFEHDPDVVAATVGQDERGRFCIKEVLNW